MQSKAASSVYINKMAQFGHAKVVFIVNPIQESSVLKCKFRQRPVYAEAQLGTRLEKDTNKMTLVLPGLQEEDSAAQLFFFFNIFWGDFLISFSY